MHKVKTTPPKPPALLLRSPTEPVFTPPDLLDTFFLFFRKATSQQVEQLFLVVLET